MKFYLLTVVLFAAYGGITFTDVNGTFTQTKIAILAPIGTSVALHEGVSHFPGYPTPRQLVVAVTNASASFSLLLSNLRVLCANFLIQCYERTQLRAPLDVVRQKVVHPPGVRTHWCCTKFPKPLV